MCLLNPSTDSKSHLGHLQTENRCEVNQVKHVKHNYSAVIYLFCWLVDSISIAGLKLISCPVPFPNANGIIPAYT